MTRMPCRSWLLAPLFLLPALLSAEDVKLREQAVHLLEMANAASLPGALSSYDQVVSFRWHENDGSVKEGTFTRVWENPGNHRDEITMGDYHLVMVISGNRISSIASGPMPPEVRELRKRLPVYLGRFDKEDVIRSVDEASVLGRAAKCISFNTQFGNTLQANQICVDAERNTLLRWQVGDELIENADYFPIAGLWEPGHIRRFMKGVLLLEVEQHMAAIQGPVDPNFFSPPSRHWDELYECKNKRRPVGVSTPMPPAGNAGTGNIDVIVHGNIRENGSVQDAEIEFSPRPDLNDEALKLVSTWKFFPLLCSDKAVTLEGDMVVHFQDR